MQAFFLGVFEGRGVLRWLIELGQFVGRVSLLEVSCRHCDRRGRYRVARLIERHGAAMGLPELRRVLSAGCPRWQSVSVYQQCGIYYPQAPLT